MAAHADVPASPAVQRGARESNSDGGRGVLFWAVSAVVGAAGAYMLHHLAPLGEHRAIAAVAVIGMGAAVGGLSAVVAAAQRHPLPPQIILATATDIEIRPVGAGDARACASLHANGLSGFFVELGPAFLRAYHRAFGASPEAVALVAVVRGRVVGTITGVVRPQAHMRWMLQRRGIALAAIALLSLPVHPRAGWRFIGSRMRRYAAGWRRHRSGHAGNGPPAEDRAVLSHVVVAGGARGAGLGERLVAAFLERARRAGAERFTLTTLDGHAGAGGFYERLGWRRQGARSNADGTSMAVYHLDAPRDGQ